MSINKHYRIYRILKTDLRKWIERENMRKEKYKISKKSCIDNKEQYKINRSMMMDD